MSDDNVVPFRRRGQRPPEPAAAPTRSRARQLADGQAAATRAKYAKAASKQEIERMLATCRPVPARITMALDLGGHEGPEVDLAVGTFERNPEGDVDLWECGIFSPNADQVKLLAEFTGFPIPWFYKPMLPGPLLGGDGRMWICWSDSRGCQSPEPDVIDDNGVLHYGGERREPPTWWTEGQGALF